MVLHFEKLKETSQDCNVKIPPKMLQLLDENYSPDCYTMARLKQCQAVHEASTKKKEKINGAKSILEKDLLGNEYKK